MRAQAHEAELARIAEQEAREAAERQRKMEEAAAKQRAKEEEIERRKQEVRPFAAEHPDTCVAGTRDARRACEAGTVEVAARCTSLSAQGFDAG